ncbi:RNA ligase family protein [Pleionea sediminis]|uniref:RNA ligase family protein n=1 Tax=Pleionea sediminis TaxID=2569479 RepID=UPI0013DDCC01|nr:RNA ligase family protein [Pleionea sediminis]
MTDRSFIKYPRTYHLEDKLDKKDDSLAGLLSKGEYFVIEEKMDGTQVGISFDLKGHLQIQSRGSFIDSRPEFDLLKQWVWQFSTELIQLLGERYILFGEWLFAKHTLYYNCLPDYFLEFDIYDRKDNQFLSTVARQNLLDNYSFIHSVRVIETTSSITLSELTSLIGKSSFITEDAHQSLAESERKHTDHNGSMEGLYIKVENASSVIARYKYIRPDFINFITSQEVHWRDRNLFHNKLK